MYFFTEKDMAILDESLHVAEDMISDFFSVTHGDWLLNQYEVCTMADMKEKDAIFSDEWFAHLLRYGKSENEKNSAVDNLDFYRIYLNDNKILASTGNGCPERLFPFLVYVLTHELVHIIRFSKYYCCRDAYDRKTEEDIVHSLTRDILSCRHIAGMKETLDFFREADSNVLGS